MMEKTGVNNAVSIARAKYRRQGCPLTEAIGPFRAEGALGVGGVGSAWKVLLG